jgi:dTDP-4-dehydrorhamnose 3,5-epimerase
MQCHPSPLPGCYLIEARRFGDVRGEFTKVVHSTTFRALGLHTDFPEVFWSSSRVGVVRGLHFQVPPADHVKLVTCVAGRVHDAVVDLRTGSPTYGHHYSVPLGADRPHLLYVPVGMAHGFLAVEEPALMLYFVSTEHSPQHDRGLRWDSAGIEWPLERSPIVSDRDAAFPTLAEFESPFTFSQGTT